jgi:hypothetical protein
VVLTAVAMKTVVLCDVTPCSPAEVYRRFEGSLLPLFVREESYTDVSADHSDYIFRIKH